MCGFIDAICFSYGQMVHDCTLNIEPWMREKILGSNLGSSNSSTQKSSWRSQVLIVLTHSEFHQNGRWVQNDCSRKLNRHRPCCGRNQTRMAPKKRPAAKIESKISITGGSYIEDRWNQWFNEPTIQQYGGFLKSNIS